MGSVLDRTAHETKQEERPDIKRRLHMGQDNSPDLHHRRRQSQRSKSPAVQFWFPGTLSVFWCLLSPDPEQIKQRRQNNTKIWHFHPRSETSSEEMQPLPNAAMQFCSWNPIGAFFL
jgi:hypothetical protein